MKILLVNCMKDNKAKCMIMIDKKICKEFILLNGRKTIKNE